MCDVFQAFCHLLNELLTVSATDVPFLVVCAYLNSDRTRIWTESRRPQFSEPYRKQEIVWPEHLRTVGGDFMGIADSLSTGLFNAFGLKDVVR
jgi:hypothetical protein